MCTWAKYKEDVRKSLSLEWGVWQAVDDDAPIARLIQKAAFRRCVSPRRLSHPGRITKTPHFGAMELRRPEDSPIAVPYALIDQNYCLENMQTLLRWQYAASVDVHYLAAWCCCHGNRVYEQLHATRDENTAPRHRSSLIRVLIRALNACIVQYLPWSRDTRRSSSAKIAAPETIAELAAARPCCSQ
jgi:hypothetical protein